MSVAQWREADIAIGGQILTFGQSMTLRVALQAFLMEMTSEGIADAMGELGKAYVERGKEINAMIHRSIEG